MLMGYLFTGSLASLLWKISMWWRDETYERERCSVANLCIDRTHFCACRYTPFAFRKCLMRMFDPPEATCNPYRQNGVRKELYSSLLR